MIRLGFSKIKEFKSCRRKYFFHYVEDLQSKSDGIGSLEIGGIVHKVLEKSYQGEFKHWSDVQTYLLDSKNEMIQDVPSELTEEMFKSFNESFELIESMVHGYLKRFFKFDLEHFKICDVEVPLTIQLSDNIVYEGAIDGVFQDKFGDYWLHEIKTMKSPGTNLLSSLEIDDQVSFYCWAFWKVFNIMPAGVLYSVMRKAIPVEPKLLKTGGLSKDKAQNCSYETYMKAITKNEFNPRDYLEILEHFQSEPKKFQLREIVYRNESEILDTEEQVKAVAADIEQVQLRGKLAGFYRNPAQVWEGGCYCPFRNICAEDSEEGREMFDHREEHHDNQRVQNIFRSMEQPSMIKGLSETE